MLCPNPHKGEVHQGEVETVAKLGLTEKKVNGQGAGSIHGQAHVP